jgi:hypothetical protein
MTAQSEEAAPTCNHRQCCLCLKRECNVNRRFMRYGELYVCGDSCIATAINVAYHAACRLGGAQEQPCGVKKGEIR